MALFLMGYILLLLNHHSTNNPESLSQGLLPYAIVLTSMSGSVFATVIIKMATSLPIRSADIAVSDLNSIPAKIALGERIGPDELGGPKLLLSFGMPPLYHRIKMARLFSSMSCIAFILVSTIARTWRTDRFLFAGTSMILACVSVGLLITDDYSS
jgi:hypothetical protein